MTTLHPALERYRSDLREAIRADIERQPVRRRLRRRVGGVAFGGALAALGVSIALAPIGGQGGVGPADAMVLDRAQSALAPPAGSVLHIVGSVTVGGDAPEPYDLWATSTAFRVIKFGHEAAWDGTTESVYDAASNTIAVGGALAPNHQAADIAATLRSLIQSGQASVTGTTTVNGQPAYVLRIPGSMPGWANGVAIGTYEVSRADDQPIIVQTTVDCTTGACPETVQFQTYEYLPSTPQNLALLSLSAQHPGARIVAAPDTLGANAG
jgi:hypothetical protein